MRNSADHRLGRHTQARRRQPNTALQLTNTDAAHSALRSPCLLSVLAAECHVSRAGRLPTFSLYALLFLSFTPRFGGH